MRFSGRAIATIVLSLVCAAPAFSQQKAEVLILGTFHMANPGHDIVNLHVDDVLAPKRQAEIAQVLEVLKKFAPTKIAVESNAGNPRIPNRYADYVAGKVALTPNEIDQIGLRLAKELGHKTVYAVDADGDFPYHRLENYAKVSGRAKELEAMIGETGTMVKEEGDMLASHTILDTLLFVNSPAYVARNDAFYYRVARFSEPGDWAGPDLVADWFRRNIRIYGNILQLIDSPNERILVIIGSGHLGWLRRDVAGNPDLRLRTLDELSR